LVAFRAADRHICVTLAPAETAIKQGGALWHLGAWALDACATRVHEIREPTVAGRRDIGRGAADRAHQEGARQGAQRDVLDREPLGERSREASKLAWKAIEQLASERGSAARRRRDAAKASSDRVAARYRALR
jgi:hypothetical protein